MDATQVAYHLPYDRLIDALADAFRSLTPAPTRGVHAIGPTDAPAQLLVMPSWRIGVRFAVKIATVCPTNPAIGRPTIQGVVVLGDAATGEFLATLDGSELTHRRTAAASALAARHLARPDSATLLIIGTGALAPYLAEAHCCVRPITRVLVWGRTPARVADSCAAIAARLPGIPVLPVTTLEAGATEADIISCATSSRVALLQAEWLAPGVHVDLVGSFSPDTREATTDVVVGARVFVDTYGGAFEEAGDLLIPMREGVIGRDHVRGDLRALTSSEVPGRQTPGERTLFKSVGSAIEDLAAADLAYDGFVGAASERQNGPAIARSAGD